MQRHALKAEDFTYDLPDERIAKYPLKKRNLSKLLLYKKGNIGQDRFKKLNNHLPSDSVLVFNNTKVLSARLSFRKTTGARIEIFCLQPHLRTVEEALTTTQTVVWQCMVGNLKRFKAEDVLSKGIAGVQLEVRLLERRSQDVLIEFKWEGGIEFSDILAQCGEMPLPPYLNRAAEESDATTYQTVYAKKEGAVAAPTAGLHFMDAQLEELQVNNHALTYLTLYVGAGTFRSVKADRLVDHKMHQERIVIQRSTIEQLQYKKGKIICVGTTSLRSLESLYWLAVKRKLQNDFEINELSQEDAYQLEGALSWKEVCSYLLNEMENRGIESIDFYSSLFIMPSYQWKVMDGLITNFHQPKSTLLALVSAWIGEDWNKVYNYALEHDFRFLSYGDSSLLLP